MEKALHRRAFFFAVNDSVLAVLTHATLFKLH
ncbi:hypothetical protein EDC56_1960 [Sinobacterium caligoides]|uniref:Uncharacterized protein n=1 Tax=Sinobacterium caligoides TaxID=933926 RepID=A0A3N2DNX6_9GAMM|nr:hypothetical protein EDC56_1960 [Sinobacterium caligoides]